MGQGSRRADLGSRRAVVLTLVVSLLLLVGGLVILHSAGSLRLGHATPTSPSVSATARPTTSGP